MKKISKFQYFKGKILPSISSISVGLLISKLAAFNGDVYPYDTPDYTNSNQSKKTKNLKN
jgi:hypothetical protein